MKIAVDEDRIFVSGRGVGAVRFADVAEVWAEKMDKITYEEVFLIVRAQAGQAITLGELDKGLAQAEQALRTRLKGFSAGWWCAAEQRPSGVRAQVWPTPA